MYHQYHLRGRILCINRIRLEFKAEREKLIKELQTVLIESDWNLKNIELP